MAVLFGQSPHFGRRKIGNDCWRRLHGALERWRPKSWSSKMKAVGEWFLSCPWREQLAAFRSAGACSLMQKPQWKGTSKFSDIPKKKKICSKLTGEWEMTGLVVAQLAPCDPRSWSCNEERRGVEAIRGWSAQSCQGAESARTATSFRTHSRRGSCRFNGGSREANGRDRPPGAWVGVGWA